MEKQKLLVIDGHSVVVRAWFAIHESLTNSKGVDTKGVFGFFNTFFKTLRTHQPEYVIATFDTKGKTFRHDMYKEYKAHRPPMAKELLAQIPMTKEVLRSMKVPIFELEGYEADDLVGTIAKWGCKQNLETRILTCDQDQLQLVNDDVKVVMYSGFGNVKFYDVDAVKERFLGLSPNQVTHYKALGGDSSDNIPGVAGIGAKTATTLLLRYKTIDALYENLDQVKEIDGLRGAKRVEERLKNGKEMAQKSLELATIVCDAPIELSLEDAKYGNFDRAEVVDALLDLEIKSLVSQVPSSSGSPVSKDEENKLKTVGVKAPTPTDDDTYYRKNFTESKTIEEFGLEVEVIDEESKLKALVSELKKCKEFAFDTETDGLMPVFCELVGISISTTQQKGYYIPIGHKYEDESLKQLPLKLVFDHLAPIFYDQKIGKVCHNANFDTMVLEMSGMKVRGVSFDTLIAASLCGFLGIGLKQLVLSVLRIEMTPITELIGKGKSQKKMSEVLVQDVAKYASADAAMTLLLKKTLEEKVLRHKQTKVFYEVELPLLPVLVSMQKTGIMLNKSHLTKLSELVQIELDIQQTALSSLMDGKEININSPKQIANYLIDDLGAPKTRRTKTGWSMDANALENYASAEDVSQKVAQISSGILKYRELSKLKSTYIDTLPKLINKKTNRVHTSFNQVGSATGRLSSNDPNIQNIPVRTELGKKVREAFVSDTKNGFSLISADYSQIELRILAHLAEEPGLIDAFKNGEDIHSSTARTMYMVDTPTPEQRRIAKVLNFGVIYGLGPQGIARQTDLSVSEGRRFINLYFGSYPGIKDYIRSVVDDAKQNGYANTIIGRRRYLPDLRSSNRGLAAASERIAVNMPIQGTAADIVKIAMVNIQNRIEQNGYQSRMLVQVHDELIFEVFEDEKEDIKKLILNLLPSALKLKVPLEISLKEGPNWGKLKELNQSSLF